MDNLNAFLVRGEDGSADVDATVEKFRSLVQKHLVERETENATISQAVNAVFDEFKGVNINVPALCSYTVSKLGNVPPTAWEAMKQRVHSYIKENPALFQVKKGKGGGVIRLADHPTAE